MATLLSNVHHPRGMVTVISSMGREVKGHGKGLFVRLEGFFFVKSVALFGVENPAYCPYGPWPY